MAHLSAAASFHPVVDFGGGKWQTIAFPERNDGGRIRPGDGMFAMPVACFEADASAPPTDRVFPSPEPAVERFGRVLERMQFVSYACLENRF